MRPTPCKGPSHAHINRMSLLYDAVVMASAEVVQGCHVHAASISLVTKGPACRQLDRCLGPIAHAHL